MFVTDSIWMRWKYLPKIQNCFRVQVLFHVFLLFSFKTYLISANDPLETPQIISLLSVCAVPVKFQLCINEMYLRKWLHLPLIARIWRYVGDHLSPTSVEIPGRWVRSRWPFPYSRTDTIALTISWRGARDVAGEELVCNITNDPVVKRKEVVGRGYL